MSSLCCLHNYNQFIKSTNTLCKEEGHSKCKQLLQGIICNYRYCCEVRSHVDEHHSVAYLTVKKETTK